MQPDYQRYRQIFAGQELPFAYVDLELLAKNAAAVVARARGKRVRIASQSIRSRAILAQLLTMQPQLRGVMCYSPREALFLSRHGFTDLLLGHPCHHPEQVAALCDSAAAGRPIVAMVDSVAHVEHLGRIAAARGVTLPLCLDVDMSLDMPGVRFGVFRSPIRTPAEALEVFAAISRSRHLRLEGVMSYEAQLAEVGDAAPGQGPRNLLVRMLKARSRKVAAARRTVVLRALRRSGARLRFVNAGGTGSLEGSAAEPGVTELTAGSGFYAPAIFDDYQGFRHQPAAGFAIEVVRRPAPGVLTCAGGGYVASGAAGPEKLPRPFLPAGAHLLPLEGVGEAQTPIRYRGPEPVGLGDPIFLRHARAGELCEHFNTLLLIAGGAVVGAAPTYRGEGMAFL